jgi:hypothetical protein
MSRDTHRLITALFSFIILSFYLYNGIMFLSIYYHELSHSYDFRNGVKINDDKIEVFLMPKSGNYSGLYTYEYDIFESYKVSQIKAYTEDKAELVELLAIILGITSFFIVGLFMTPLNNWERSSDRVE